MRRYTWCRIHHDLVDDTRWRLVARMSGAPQHIVEAFVVRLDIYASANRPRGSVDGFNVVALAAHWNLPSEEQLARIYAALEHPQVGWIDQDQIVTFWERNPDVEDPTAAERKRRQRAKQREAKEEARRVRLGYPQSRVTDRDTVTVTTIPDQIIKKERAADEERRGRAGDSEAWLAVEGKRIVAERCGLLPSRAWTEVMRWRKELDGDGATLASLIHDADVMGLEGGRFTDRIRDQIIRRRYEANGPGLPLAVSIKRAGGGGP
ncbi:MAG: hypothetical protein IT481_08450 [Gammaproteobacteria bacterium]|nr:hypothetical protein [Gammaproteobacteria bacterium]